ncbi:MAG: hypothetical protein ABSH33_14725 [Steroidobacteraceae bacterium]
MIAIAAIATAGLSGTAHAATNVGFVWASCPTCTGSYTPVSSYAWNSSGGDVTITNVATGVYTVDFDDLYNDHHLNNVQVSAYATSGYCTVGGWDVKGSSSAAEMYVNCFDASGNPANSYFTLLYHQRTTGFGAADEGAAFLWANQPTTSSYTPDSSYNYNSTGGTNTILRNSTGNYTVTIAGLAKGKSGFDHEQGDVQVTAYGSTPIRCAVVYWFTSTPNTTVNVQCYNSAGAAADEDFSLAFALRTAFGSAGSSTVGAYGWDDIPAETYVVQPPAQYNGFKTGPLTAQYDVNNNGLYTVTIPGDISWTASNVVVTAVDNDTAGAYCNVESWGTQTIDIACYNQGGALSDSQFNVAFDTFQ